MLNWNHDNIPILLPGCGGFVTCFFSGPLHLLKQHLFQGPEGKGARRSGWPEPYQGHITIGRFNKRETSSKLQLVSAVLFKIGSILLVFIPIMKSST